MTAAAHGDGVRPETRRLEREPGVRTRL